MAAGLACDITSLATAQHAQIRCNMLHQRKSKVRECHATSRHAMWQPIVLSLGSTPQEPNTSHCQ
jgi:hypothetical protein